MRKRIFTAIIIMALVIQSLAGFSTLSNAAVTVYTNNVYNVIVSSSDGTCNLRTGPGMAYDVLLPIYNGNSLRITAVSQNSSDGLVWGQTTYNGYSGWIAVNLTIVNNVETAASAIYDVTVTQQENIFLRTGPGTEYEELYHPYNGQVLRIDETMVNSFDGRPWGRTTINGMQGWVSLDWTERNAPTVYNQAKNTIFYNNHYTALVSAWDNYVNLRTGPGLAYSIIQPIYNGNYLYVSAVLDNSSDGLVWGETTYNGTTGWIAIGSNTTITEMDNASTAQYYVTVQNSNNIALRKGPGTEYDLIVGNMANGTKLYITETVINSFDGRPWGKTNVNGMDGWVSLNWTSRVGGMQDTILGTGTIVDFNSNSAENTTQATYTYNDTENQWEDIIPDITADNKEIQTFDNNELGDVLVIPGLGTVSFDQMEFTDTVYTYAGGENSEHLSGDEAKYLCLFFNIVNTTDESKDYLSNSEIIAVHDEKTKYGGWAFQIADIDGNSCFVSHDDIEYVYSIEPQGTGRYIAGVTLPNEVIDGTEDLKLVMSLDDTEITFNIDRSKVTIADDQPDIEAVTPIDDVSAETAETFDSFRTGYSNDNSFSQEVEWDVLDDSINSYENGDFLYSAAEEDISIDADAVEAYYDNLLIVYLWDDLSTEEKIAIADSVNGVIVGKSSGGINMLQIMIEKTNLETINGLIDILMENDHVLYAFYSYPLLINDYSDTEIGWDGYLYNEFNPSGADWWAEAIQAYSAWKLDSLTSPITIGIIDSGFETTHIDFEDKNQDSVLTMLNNNTIDQNPHGTHVAGLMVSQNNSFKMKGILSKAKGYCVDWSPLAHMDLSNADLIMMTNQMINLGTKVINFSWGTEKESFEGYTYNNIYKDYNEENTWFTNIRGILEAIAISTTGAYGSYEELIEAQSRLTAFEWLLVIIQLIKNGKEDFLLVQAAGNGLDGRGPGIETDNSGYLCAINEDIFNILSEETRNSLFIDYGITFETIKDHIVIVGAVKNQRNDKGEYLLSNFSDFGINIDICAPGENVYSTVLNDDHDYLNGTSMAAPIVAGSAAYIWSLDPSLSAGEVKEKLISTAGRAVGVTGEDIDRVYPMLNLGSASWSTVMGVVKGTVVDLKTEEPISDATIKVNGEMFQESEVTTFDDGEFYVAAVGDTTITISKAGYPDIVIDINVEKKQDVDLGILYLGDDVFFEDIDDNNNASLVNLSIPEKAKIAYLNELLNNQWLISNIEHFGQQTQSGDSFMYTDHAVSFWDITGDGIPEMFYIYSENKSQGYCRIVSFQNGSTVTIKNEDNNDIWVYGAANGNSGTIFTDFEPFNTHLYVKTGTIGGRYRYDSIEEYNIENNILTLNNTLYMEYSYSLDSGEPEWICKDIVGDVSYDVINSLFNVVVNHVDKVQVGCLKFYAYDNNIDYSNNCISMSYEEALLYLQTNEGANVDTNNLENHNIDTITEQAMEVLLRYNEMDKHSGCASLSLAEVPSDLSEQIGYFDFGYGPVIMPQLSQITDCSTIEDALNQRKEYFSDTILGTDEDFIKYLKEYDDKVYLGWAAADYNLFEIDTLSITSYDDNTVNATCTREFGGDWREYSLVFEYYNGHLRLVSIDSKNYSSENNPYDIVFQYEDESDEEAAARRSAQWMMMENLAYEDSLETGINDRSRNTLGSILNSTKSTIFYLVYEVAKDVEPEYICVLKDWTIDFYSRPKLTLGDLSKMTDDEIIEYAQNNLSHRFDKYDFSGPLPCYPHIETDNSGNRTKDEEISLLLGGYDFYFGDLYYGNYDQYGDFEIEYIADPEPIYNTYYGGFALEFTLSGFYSGGLDNYLMVARCSSNTEFGLDYPGSYSQITVD